MRFDVDTYREIADSLVRNKSRSLLTGFGVFWGIFMLLFLMGGGQGLKQLISANFEGFATNTAILLSDRTSKPWKGMKEGRRWNMTFNDVERVKRMVPELETVTPMLSQWGQEAVNGTNTINGNIKGVNADYCLIEEPRLKYGRYLNESDVVQERKVCVIGKRIYTSLFPDGGDPCGTMIKVGPLYYQVIGVDYSSGNININGSADESITIPISVVRKVYHSGNDIELLCVTGRSGVQLSTLEDRLRQVMAREHNFDPTDKDALFVLNTEQLFAIIDNLFKGLNFLIWLVGLGTILAGVIGVSNIMMVTVKERTTEIGIRRAIGATPTDILSQIIMESISLTMVAGSFGIVFAVLLLSLLEAIVNGRPDAAPVDFQVTFWTAVISALLLTVLGVIAGLAPASRAMAIKPVDAMRDE